MRHTCQTDSCVKAQRLCKCKSRVVKTKCFSCARFAIKMDSVDIIANISTKLGAKIHRVIINTGNILSLNDITKKPGQNPTDEIIEALDVTLKDYENGSKAHTNSTVMISRNHDDLAAKMSEHELSDLKIGLKLFLRNDDQTVLTEALDKAFTVLNVRSVHNVILVYYNNQGLEDSALVAGKLKNAWRILERYAKQEKILQIGLSDVDEQAFRTFYDWAEVKPSIIQINLATCCVVPPTLQSFCKEKEVQLLTHSDPSDILPDTAIESVFGKSLKLDWALRFLVHIKCRGVLTTKGYLLSFHSTRSI